MLMARLKNTLNKFRDDTSGSAVVETVIVLPLLFWALMASYEFFEVHRYKSVREKATYTVADLFSRETSDPIGVTETYMDNVKVLFDAITNDEGPNQIRVSVIKYDEQSDTFSVSWSEVRGTGSLQKLTDAEVKNAHGEMPILDDGEEIVVVDTKSKYYSLFNVGLNENLTIENRMFSSLRFAPQLCWENVCGGTS